MIISILDVQKEKSKPERNPCGAPSQLDHFSPTFHLAESPEKRLRNGRFVVSNNERLLKPSVTFTASQKGLFVTSEASWE